MTDLGDRTTYVGGSDIGSIMGVNPWKSKKELWEEKTGRKEPEDLSDNPNIRRGVMLESRDIVTDEYLHLIDPKKEQIGKGIRLTHAPEFEHKNYAFLKAHLDFIMKHLGSEKILEVKCPRSFVCTKYKNEGVPDAYRLQMQFYMLLSGIPQGEFLIFNADAWDLQVIAVESDQELQKMILDACLDFWALVKEDVEPEEEETKVKLPTVKGKSTDMTGNSEVEELIERLQEAKSMKDAGDKTYKALKSQIIDIMGQNEAIFTPKARIYASFSDGKITIDGKKLEKDYPQVYEACKKQGDPYRNFKPYFFKGDSE